MELGSNIERGQRPPDQAADHAADGAERRLQDRLAKQADGGGRPPEHMLGDDKKDAVPYAHDGAVNKTAPLSSAGQHAGRQHAERLQRLQQDQAVEGGPHAGAFVQGHEHAGRTQVAQHIITALGQQQADHQPAPRGLLPVLVIVQAEPVEPARHVVEQADVALGAIKTLFKGAVALRADHRHGRSYLDLSDRDCFTRVSVRIANSDRASNHGSEGMRTHIRAGSHVPPRAPSAGV